MQIDRLDIVIRAQAQQAAQQVNALNVKMEALAKVMVRTSQSTGNSVGAMHKFSDAAKSAAGAVLGLSGKVATSFSLIGRMSKKLTAASSGLRSLLGIALGFYGVRTLFNWGKEAIQLSSDLAEVQNVVENSFGTKGTEAVEKFTKTSIQDFGLAELAAKQYASRFQAMGNAMGITTGQVAKATEVVADRMNVDAGYDKIADNMGAMSLNLTKLTADMASFYNVEQDAVAEAMNAVYTGQTRPLRRYGLDLTQATLQEWANKQGIEAKVSAMTQAEKTMLRYQYVMANTATIQGDFQRTMYTWANQTRILKQNIQVLAKTIGETLVNALRPVIIWLNKAIGAIISFAETVGNALGKIFGWEIQHTPASNAADMYDTMADAVEDIGDAGDDASGGLDKATKSAEKLKRTILGFDELNVLNDPNSGSGSSSGGSGKSGGSSGDTGSTDASGADFQIVRGESWVEAYKSEIDSLEELGEYIAQALKKTLQKIDWQDTYEGARKFGKGLASFLNGIFKDPTVFSTVGKTIGGSLNTALEVLYSYGSTFNWKKYGSALGISLNNFFTTFDWGLSAKTFSTFVNGYTEAFRAAIKDIPAHYLGVRIGLSIKSGLDGIDWENNVFPAAKEFGTKLAKFLKGLITPELFTTIGATLARRLKVALIFLNSFGDQLKEDGTFEKFGDSIAAALNEFFLKHDIFMEMTHTLNTWALGLVETVGKALRRTRWNEIGKKIREAIEDVKFGEILDGLDDVIADAINAVIDTAAGLLNIDTLDGPFADTFKRIKENVEKIGSSIDWPTITEAIGSLVDALKPAFAGFADGFIEVMGTLAEIGGAALTAIGEGLQVIANALNSLPEGTLEVLGATLGRVAASLLVISAADKGISALGGLIGKLTGAGVATSLTNTATAVGTTGANASKAAGPVSTFIKKFLGTTAGSITGVYIALSLTAQSIDQVRDKARGGNGILSDFGQLLDTMGNTLTPELKEQMFHLANEIEDTGADSETAASKLAELFKSENIDPRDLELALSQAEDALGLIGAEDGAAPTVRRALELMGDEAVTAAEKVKMTDSEYYGLRDVLGELYGNVIQSDDQLKLLYETLDKSKQSSEPAEEAYGRLREQMEFWGLDIDELDKAVKESTAFKDTELGAGNTRDKVELARKAISDLKDMGIDVEKTGFGGMAKAFGDIVKGSDDAKDKTGLFKDGFWKFAGGVATQVLLMLGIGTGFKSIGDKADENKKKVSGFSDGFWDLHDEFKTLTPRISEDAENVVSTATNKVETGMAGFALACGNFMNAGNKAVEDKAGINSPSKVWAGYGRNLVQGMSNGIGEEERTLTNKVSSLIRGLTSSFRGLADTMYDIGKSVGSSLASGMKNTHMPSLKYYISDWRYHDLGDGGTSATPVYSPWWYASGGFPNTGELFWARENGPEMVGRMGSRTAVANNKQITEGIRAAVVDGMMEVAMATGGGGSDSSMPYVINAVLKTENDEVLARAVERGTARRNSRFNVVSYT